MPIGSTDDFSADEQTILNQLRTADLAEEGGNGTTTDDDGQPTPGLAAANSDPDVVAAIAQATAAEAADDAGTVSPAPAPAAAAPASSPASAPAASEAHQDRNQGNLTAALRASRRAERANAERAAAAEARLSDLETQLQDLRQQTGQTDPDAPLSDAELRELETDLPAVGKLAREVMALRQQTATTRQAAAAPASQQQREDDFVPPVETDPEVQDAIDSNPDLLSWQTSHDQTNYQLCAKYDEALRAAPEWRGRPMAERFQRVVELVKQTRGTASAPAPSAASSTATPRRDPAAAIAAAPARAPSTLSDVAGGAAPKPEAPGLAQFMKMSDDDILNMLGTGG